MERSSLKCELSAAIEIGQNAEITLAKLAALLCECPAVIDSAARLMINGAKREAVGGVMNTQKGQSGKINIWVAVVIVVILFGAAVLLFSGGSPYTGTWGRVPTLIGNTPASTSYIISAEGGGSPPAGTTMTVRFTFDGNVVESIPSSTSGPGGKEEVEVSASSQGLATVRFVARDTGSVELTAAAKINDGDWVVDGDVRAVEVQLGTPSQ